MTKRDVRIDSLRGIFLLIMIINHFGGPFQKFTSESLGFVSAAEGFIFISGFVFAFVYMRYIVDERKLFVNSFKRALLIYRYHLNLIFGVAIVAIFIHSYQLYWKDILSPYFDYPIHYIVFEALLLHQPQYMDILPIYVIFVMAAPFILRSLHSGHEKIVLTVTLLLWILGQFINPFKAIVHVLHIGATPGYFNIFSWQIVWVLGMYAGFHKYSKRNISIIENRYVQIIAILTAIILLIIRYKVITFPFNLDDLTDKMDLGIIRLMNTISHAVIIWMIVRNVPENRGILWLDFVGRYSLQIFSYHVFILYLSLPVKERLEDVTGFWGYFLYILLLVASLSLPVYLYENYKKYSVIIGSKLKYNAQKLIP
ncbi:OpgC domain-containing protein [candidate division KSB1 bacterium]|nr:OpgC domain-containing protein [candidate division KSB1 bacterium]